MKSSIIKTIKQNLTILGDSHRYTSPKGEISLIYPTTYTMNEYEIYCIGGDLFEDIERYATLEEAEKRIDDLL